MDGSEDKKKSHRGRKRWTEEEDAILHQEASKQSSNGNVRDWNKIATKLPGRTNKDCRKRWVNKVCGGLKKGLWDREEDQRLQAAVEKHGLRWPLIAAEVGFRSPDQCAKRWQYGLDPRLKHREWSQDEDDLLLSLVQQRGRQWKAIQENHYPTRSRIDLKNRYTILMRRMNINGGDQDHDQYPDDEASETSSISWSTSEEAVRSRAASLTGYESDHDAIHSHPHHHMSITDSLPPPSIHAPDWLNDPMTTTASFSTLTASGSGIHDHHPSSLTHHLTHDPTALGDGITPTAQIGSLDFLDDPTPMNLHSALSHDMLTSPWDDPLLDESSYHVQGFQDLIPNTGFGTATSTTTTTTTTTDVPVSSSMESGKQDMHMELTFDPELMNPSGPGMVAPHSLSMDGVGGGGGGGGIGAGSSSSGGATTMMDADFISRPRSVPVNASPGVDQGGGGMDLEGNEDGEVGDMGKVVIAVEGCDKDTLDYLFSMTRPIKQRVKMEITM